MINKSIKHRSVIKFLCLLTSILYGLFVIAAVQRLYRLGSGDINAYVTFFEAIDIFTIYNEYTIRGDGIFRVSVVFLANFFEMEPLGILTSIAFVMATVISYIYLINIKSSRDFMLILPLLLMVFFTPMVTNLFASGIRSGIAFSIALITMIYSKGVRNYILFALSALVHLSMIPIIGLYTMFFVLNKLKIKSSFTIRFLLLILFSFFLVLFVDAYKFNVTSVSSSVFFVALIFFVAILMIFANTKGLENVYGFMSIGLMMIYLAGILFDLSFIRYIGNAIILYLLFLIDEGKVGEIQVFSIGYVPFFLLTLFYSLSN